MKWHLSFNVGRSLAIAAVSYSFIHAGSATLAESALSWHLRGALQSSELWQLLVGLVQVVAVFGLFVSARPYRMLAAMALALASLAPALGLEVSAVSGWCVAVTLLFAWIPNLTARRVVGATDVSFA
jgi:hypothetical protein